MQDNMTTITLERKYRPGIWGNYQRKQEEKKLFAQGFKLAAEREVKEWSAGLAFILLILFFPLVFFAKIKFIVVTYWKKSDE